MNDFRRVGNERLNQVYLSLILQENYAQQGFIAVGSTPEQFAAHIRQQILKFQRVVSDAKIQVE